MNRARALRTALFAAALTLSMSDACPDEPPAAAPAVYPAALGATTRAPTQEEIAPYGLEPVKVRPRGRIVETVEKAGPAAKAGLVVGDAIVALDDNDLYSADDLSDFLLVSRAGRRVAVHVRRKGEEKERVLEVVLAASPTPLATDQIVWQFSGLGQLDEALATAKKESKRVLVGLSGADT